MQLQTCINTTENFAQWNLRENLRWGSAQGEKNPAQRPDRSVENGGFADLQLPELGLESD